MAHTRTQTHSTCCSSISDVSNRCFEFSKKKRAIFLLFYKYFLVLCTGSASKSEWMRLFYIFVIELRFIWWSTLLFEGIFIVLCFEYRHGVYAIAQNVRPLNDFGLVQISNHRLPRQNERTKRRTVFEWSNVTNNTIKIKFIRMQKQMCFYTLIFIYLEIFFSFSFCCKLTQCAHILEMTFACFCLYLFARFSQFGSDSLTLWLNGRYADAI